MPQKTPGNVILPTLALTPELAEQLDAMLARVRAIRAFQPPTKAALLRELIHRGLQALEPEVQQAERDRAAAAPAGRPAPPRRTPARRHTAGAAPRARR
jgi:hypothetical protein